MSLDLRNGLTSPDTPSRPFRLPHPDALSRRFGRSLDQVGAAGSGVLAVDGETLRRSFDRATGASRLHVARPPRGRCADGARPSRGGGGRERDRGGPDLNGALVTADAIHCQRDTAAVVLERGGDDLFSLKANRPAMPADVEAFSAAPGALDRHGTVDADHGRIERRRHATAQDTARLFYDRRCAGEPARPGMAAIAVVDSIVMRDGQASRSRRCSLSSVRTSSGRFAPALRAHASIENSPHRVPDTVFDGDRDRTRRHDGPENPAVLRRPAVDVLRAARPDTSIKRKRRKAGWSDAFARSILAQMRWP